MFDPRLRPARQLLSSWVLASIFIGLVPESPLEAKAPSGADPARLELVLVPAEGGDLPAAVTIQAAPLGGVFSRDFGDSVRIPAEPKGALHGYRVVDGVVSIDRLPAGSTRFRVSARDFATTLAVEATLRGGETTRLEVPIARDAPLRTLRIIDGEGRPIAGADVEIGDSDTIVDTGTSDADGLWSSTRVRGSAFEARIAAEGFAFTREVEILRRIDEAGGTLEVVLARAGSIAVEVQSGAEARADEVTVTVAGFPDLLRPFSRPVRGGRVTFSGVPVGRHRLSFGKGRDGARLGLGRGRRIPLGSAFVEVRADETTAVFFQVPRRVTLTGTIELGGAAVDGGQLRCREAIDDEGRPGRAVAVGADGSFSIALLEGLRRLTYSSLPLSEDDRPVVPPAGTAPVIVHGQVRVDPAASQRDLDFDTAPLEVRVVDREGAPAAGVSLRIASTYGQTDAQGRLRCPQVPCGTLVPRLASSGEPRLLLAPAVEVAPGSPAQVTATIVPVRTIEVIERDRDARRGDVTLSRLPPRFLGFLRFFDAQGRVSGVHWVASEGDVDTLRVPVGDGTLISAGTTIAGSRVPFDRGVRWEERRRRERFLHVEVAAERTAVRVAPVPSGALVARAIDQQGEPVIGRFAIVAAGDVNLPSWLARPAGVAVVERTLPAGETTVRFSPDGDRWLERTIQLGEGALEEVIFEVERARPGRSSER